jgi:hypothetical protein
LPRFAAQKGYKFKGNFTSEQADDIVFWEEGIDGPMRNGKSSHA